VNQEDAIRERAYSFWEIDGRQAGNADVYWLKAEDEILIGAMEAAAHVMTSWDGAEQSTILRSASPLRPRTGHNAPCARVYRPHSRLKTGRSSET
jgi:Protein of unknown function (DUF2934)